MKKICIDQYCEFLHEDKNGNEKGPIDLPSALLCKNIYVMLIQTDYVLDLLDASYDQMLSRLLYAHYHTFHQVYLVLAV